MTHVDFHNISIGWGYAIILWKHSVRNLENAEFNW